ISKQIGVVNEAPFYIEIEKIFEHHRQVARIGRIDVTDDRDPHCLRRVEQSHYRLYEEFALVFVPPLCKRDHNRAIEKENGRRNVEVDILRKPIHVITEHLDLETKAAQIHHLLRELALRGVANEQISG